jgi:hypothetical protein
VTSAFQDAIDQPAGKVTLLGVNEHDTGKSSASIAGHERGFYAVFNRGDLVWMET